MYSFENALSDYFDRNKSFKREVALFLGYKENNKPEIISVSTDDSFCSVTFDFLDIWQHIKNSNSKYTFFRMFHSHPPSIEHMSSIDKNMVHGWCVAFGKSLGYNIVLEDKIVNYICYYSNKKIQIYKHFSWDVDDMPEGFEWHDSFEHKDLSVQLFLIISVVLGISKADISPSNEDIENIKNFTNKILSHNQSK